MKSGPRTTVRRYNLLLEVTALVVAALILSLAMWVTLGEINQRYLDLRLADAAKVRFLFHNHLGAARQRNKTIVQRGDLEGLPLFQAGHPIVRLELNFFFIPTAQV